MISWAWFNAGFENIGSFFIAPAAAGMREQMLDGDLVHSSVIRGLTVISPCDGAWTEDFVDQLDAALLDEREDRDGSDRLAHTGNTKEIHRGGRFIAFTVG